MGSNHTTTFGSNLAATSIVARVPQSEEPNGVREALTPSRAPSFSKWQTEREALLQTLCESIAAAKMLGKPVRRSARRFSRRWNGRAYKADPPRKLALSEGTLLRNFYHWRKNGCLPSAFRLHYQPSPPSIPAPILCRFVEFCSATRLPNVTAAVRAFNASCRNPRRGSRKKLFAPLTVAKVRRYFKAEKFQALQECLCEISDVETRLGSLRLAFITEFKTRWPVRPKRKWTRNCPNFEI